MSGLIDFSDLAVGGWVGFPMSCISGYLFLWDQYLPSPTEKVVQQKPKKKPEHLIKESLRKEQLKDQ